MNANSIRNPLRRNQYALGISSMHRIHTTTIQSTAIVYYLCYYLPVAVFYGFAMRVSKVNEFVIV